jgi:hypothetical protein
MRRAELAERLINHEKGHYELGLKNGKSPSHWVDTVQSVADGCQSSELRVATEARDDLMDTVKDDVELGVRLGQLMKPGQECFSATVSDQDDRDLHFFFLATSEAEVVEKLLAAFNEGKP